MNTDSEEFSIWWELDRKQEGLKAKEALARDILEKARSRRRGNKLSEDRALPNKPEPRYSEDTPGKRRLGHETIWWKKAKGTQLFVHNVATGKTWRIP